MVDNGKEISDDNGCYKTRKTDEIKEYKGSEWGYRHIISFMLFVCFTAAYAMRACMGVALVAMVDNGQEVNNIKAIPTHANSFGSLNESFSLENDDSNFTNTLDDSEQRGILHALLLVPPYPKFKWNKKVQDTLQSSFYWGYLLMQIPAGQLAHRFGAKYLHIGAMMVNCVVSILLPWTACYGGWIPIILCRILQGLTQACIVPGIHTLLGKWAPIQERGRMSAIAYGGNSLGAVVGIPLTGFIAASSLGWPGIFRFYGVICGIVGGLMWWLVSDSPAMHPKISAAEKRYIEENLGNKQDNRKVKKQLPIPWSRILRHPGMYAIVAAHTGQTWCQVTLFSEVPAFMDGVMRINIKANGVLTALPFLVMWLVNFLYCWAADMLIIKNILSVIATRKLANSIGSVLPALLFIALAFVPKNVYTVETILILICTFKTATNSGFMVNHIDISPKFAGTMISISNFVSNIFGSLAPVVAAFLLTDVRSEYDWRNVFIVAATMYLVSNTIYVIFGTANVEEWNDPPIEDEEKLPPETCRMLKENIREIK